jgi:Helix-turn-helix domain
VPERPPTGRGVIGRRAGRLKTPKPGDDRPQRGVARRNRDSLRLRVVERPEGPQTGADCRARRKAAGLSLRQMANRAHLDYSALSRFERGERTPADLDHVLRAYAALVPRTRPQVTTRKQQPGWVRPAVWLFVVGSWSLLALAVVTGIELVLDVWRGSVVLAAFPLLVRDVGQGLVLSGSGRAVVFGDAAVMAGLMIGIWSVESDEDVIAAVGSVILLGGLHTRLLLTALYTDPLHLSRY